MDSTLDERFELAVESIKKLPTSHEGAPKQTNEDKLRVYALFKQATLGDNDTTKPGFWDVVKKYKWEAWEGLKGMRQNEAKKLYIEQLVKMTKGMDDIPEVREFVTTITGANTVEMRTVSKKPKEESARRLAATADSEERSAAPSRAYSEVTESEDEFCDSFEDTRQAYAPSSTGNVMLPQHSMNGSMYEHLEPINSDAIFSPQPINQFRSIIRSMQQELASTTERVSRLEAAQVSTSASARRKRGLLASLIKFVTEDHTRTLVIVLWPVIVNLFFYLVMRRRRRTHQ